MQSPLRPPRGKPVEVHNVCTVYGMNPDGSRADQPFAAFGQRPQDWGDKERWTYHRFRYEWQTAPDRGRPHWINNFHGWTDLKLEPHKYPTLFSGLMVQILWPGTAWQFCGQQFLQEEDFWRESWGPMPPFYDGPDQDFGELPGYEPDPQEEDEAVQMMARVFEKPTPVIIDLPAFDLFQLIGVIQFASRGLPPEHHLHSFIRKAGENLTDAVVLATEEPKLRRYIEMGWNPTYDMGQKDEER